MKLTFSQGIVKHNTDDGTILGNPKFLIKSSGGDKVNLRAPVYNGNGIGPLQLAYAHRDTHYLLTINSGAGDLQAWGYGSASDHNGAFASGAGGGSTSNEFWLWVELDRITGAVKYGYTKVAPTSGSTPPQASSPQNRADDQHWYNTTARTMNVWRKMSAPPYGSWREVVRVFVAQYSYNSNFTSLSVNSPSFIGTQAGLMGVFKAGSLIFDNTGKPLLRTDNNNGTVFFTTEDIFSAGLPTSSLFQIEGILVDAIAGTPAAAYTMVYFNDFNEILPLNGLNQDNVIFGMVEEPIGVSGQLVKVTLDGIITNGAWNWDYVGQQIFVNTTGNLVKHAIVNDQLPVAVALSPTQIVLRLPKLFLDNSIAVLSLDDLTDVALSLLNDKDYLQFDSTSGSWTNAPIDLNVSGLNDVSLGSPLGDGDVLQYDLGSGKWVSEPLNVIQALTGLIDVSLGSPLSDGDVLQYDSGSGKWVNGPGAQSSASLGSPFPYLMLDASNGPVTGTLEIIGNGSPLASLLLTGQLLASDGSIEAPGYSWRNQPNSGWSHPDYNMVSLSLDGEEAVRFLKAGASPGPELPEGLPFALGIDLYLKNDGDGDSQLRIETDALGRSALMKMISAVSTWTLVNDGTTNDLDFKWEDSKRLTIGSDGALSVLGGSPGYEALVTNDNHIPNRRYLHNQLGQDLGEYTVAGLPSASNYPNYYALVTDYGSPGRVVVRSDGTNWRYIAEEGAIVA